MPQGAAGGVDGILPFDKPLGWTSNQALQRIRRRLGPGVRGGYQGTLDPLATGLLPIAFGTARGFLSYFAVSPKLYRVEARLGQQTRTGDGEGEVLAQGPVPDLGFAEMASDLAGRIGTSLQVPPMFSALKQKGIPLYRLARQKIEVDRPPRPIEVFRVSLLSWVPPTACFELECGPGVYVRSWVEDWARSLGTVAHVSGLRRLRVGCFREEDLVAWEDLETVRDRLRSVDWPLAHLSRLELDPREVDGLIRGQPVRIPGPLGPGPLRLYDRAGVFLGLGSDSGPDGLRVLRLCPTDARLFRSTAGTGSHERGDDPGTRPGPLCEKGGPE